MKEIATINSPSGRVKLVTLGEFLKTLKIKVVDEYCKLYNQNVKSDRSAPFMSSSEYRRQVAYLKEYSSFLENCLVEHLNTIEINGSTISEVVEDASVESMKQMGTPDFAVFGGKGLLILNSKDFELWLKFEDSGQIFAAIPCLNTTRNFNVKVDWGKVNFKLSDRLPKNDQHRAEMERVDRDIAKAITTLNGIKEKANG